MKRVKTKGFHGRTFTDFKEQLHEGSNPQQWEAPRMSWPPKEFDKHRHVFCFYYLLCLDYAKGLHWPGWSCAWCQWNPERERLKEEINPKSKQKRIIKPLPKVKETISKNSVEKLRKAIVDLEDIGGKLDYD